MTIYLLRHAQAGSRHDWPGDDLHRPLSSKGRKQVALLLDQFSEKTITRVLSSAYVRCIQTVEPIAERLGVAVEVHDAMTEGARPKQAIELVRSLAGTDALLCSHGDVIPEVVRALAADGLKVNGRRTAAKGGTFVIDTTHGKLVSATYVVPPGR